MNFKSWRTVKMVRKGLVILTAAILTGSFYTSCGGNTSHSDDRCKEVKAALAAIDDSVSVKSPAAERLIKKGMKNATDSLDYYDFCLRQLRYTMSFDTTGYIGTAWQIIYNFLKRQPNTPRVRGMLGYIKNLKANHNHKYHNNQAEEISLYYSAYQDLIGSDSERNIPNVCANLGDAYIAINDLPRAAKWYRHALVVADSLQMSERHRLSLYLGLGRVYVGIGDYKNAAECYRKIDDNITLMPLGMKVYFLNNYGNYFYYRGNYGMALATFIRMKKLLEQHGLDDNYEMFLCKINMADTYLNLDSLDYSKRCLDEAEAFFTKIGNKTGIYYAHTIRMGLALEDNDVAKVRRILKTENIDEDAIEFQLTNIRQRYLRDYYVKTGDYKRAYENLCRSMSRNDSLKHSTDNMRTSDIIMRYTQDTLKLHHRIAMQEKDADVHKARWGVFVSVLLVVVLALILLYAFTYSRKRRLQMQMELMNIKLMNVRSRISPHFIFNVLNNHISKADKHDAGELMAMARLIRANLNISGKYFVTLKEELDFVKYYISVEQQCLEGGLTFNIDASPDNVLQSVKIPSMFIQILVENAIKHGLKGCKHDKALLVEVKTDDEWCSVSVTDNGRGFDIRCADPNSTHTGLNVIRSTINLLNREYKLKMKLSINNIENADGSVAGCKVNIITPVKLPP